jgi:hypothetical protein
MMLSMAVQLLLGFIYFGSTAAFNAFSGVGVITLTLSYAVPIIASVMNGRQQVKEGSFYLGALGTFCNWVAISKKSVLPSPLSYLPIQSGPSSLFRCSACPRLFQSPL